MLGVRALTAARVIGAGMLEPARFQANYAVLARTRRFFTREEIAEKLPVFCGQFGWRG